MFPLLVMVCLFYTHDDHLSWKLYLRTWPLWIISIIFIIWRVNVDFLDGPKTFARLYGLHSFAHLKMYADHPIYRVETLLATLPVYAKLLAWPTGLHMERGFSIYTTLWAVPPLLGLGLIIAAAIYIGCTAHLVQRKDPLSWGLLWFAAAHAPDTGILVPMNALFLEHWMYLPSIGIFLATGEILVSLCKQKTTIIAIGISACALLFIGALASKTYAQNMIWRDPPSFYNNIFAYGEQSARAHNNLALYYADQNNFQSAIDQFQQAIAVSDSYAETRHNLALVYLRMPNQKAHLQDAIDNLKRAIEIDPGFYRSYETLGDVYAILLNDQEDAALYRKKALEIKKLRQ